jgi:hypothetical protein
MNSYTGFSVERVRCLSAWANRASGRTWRSPRSLGGPVRESTPKRRRCYVSKQMTSQRNANGRAVGSISAGCLRYPDSAKIRRGDKGRYPKIARKFHPSPLRL